jgi:putative restriction endonuclease
MTSGPSIFERFQCLKTWRRGAEEAPHKPLLILYALGRWHTSRLTRIPFADVDRDLTPLLKEFGPQRGSYHPEYPFWRLQNDGIWEVQGPPDLKERRRNTGPKPSELLRQNVTGGFPDSVFAVLYADPAIVFDLAQSILDARFPSSQHQKILERVGLWRKESGRGGE